MTTQTPQPTEAYLLFAGQIDQAAVQRIFTSAAVATNPAANVKHVHILFQSFGGIVGKALQPFNGDPNGKKTGIIMVIVTLQ